MSATQMIQRLGRASPRWRTKFVAAYYLVTALTCAFVLYYRGGMALAADVIVTIVYLTITALFYTFSKGAAKK